MACSKCAKKAALKNKKMVAAYSKKKAVIKKIKPPQQ